MNLLACPSLGDFVIVVISQNLGWLVASGLFVSAVAACLGAATRDRK